MSGISRLSNQTLPRALSSRTMNRQSPLNFGWGRCFDGTDQLGSSRLGAAFSYPTACYEGAQWGAESMKSLWAPRGGELHLLQSVTDMQISEENSGERKNSLTGSPNRSRSPTPPNDSPPGSYSPPTAWSPVVKKNHKLTKHPSVSSNVKRKKTRSFPGDSRPISITLPECCATPNVKIFCSCCGEESVGKSSVGGQTEDSKNNDMRPRMIPVATSQLGFCRFCQVNGEPPKFYQSHNLRSDDGKVTCPVLREYRCPICRNEGGDNAHTIKYCPLARNVQPKI
jgi:hypothetical protein